MIVRSLRFQSLLTLAVCALFALASVPKASAVLVVYEPFDYPEGSELYDHTAMAGLNGGGGFGAAWTGRANNVGAVPDGSTSVQAISLAHPTHALPTTGGHVFITGEFGTVEPARNLSDSARALLANSPTTWISFLAQRQGEATDPAISNLPNNPYPRGVNVSLFNDVTLNSELVGFGNSSNASDNTWSVIPVGSGGQREGAYDPPGGVAGGGPENMGAATFPYEELQWVVVRIDHHVGNDDIYMWLSPDPSVQPDIMDADATILNTDSNSRDFTNIGAIRPFVGAVQNPPAAGQPPGATYRPFGEYILDEIRIGTSYGAMSSTQVVPEPSALCLLLLGSLGLLLRRRAA